MLKTKESRLSSWGSSEKSRNMYFSVSPRKKLSILSRGPGDSGSRTLLMEVKPPDDTWGGQVHINPWTRSQNPDQVTPDQVTDSQNPEKVTDSTWTKALGHHQTS